MRPWSFIHFIILGVFLFSHFVRADNYSGVIVSKNPFKIQLSLLNRTYLLDTSNSKSASFLKKMQVGDFLSFEANENKKNDTLQFVSINFVGLKSLIGSWYNFEDNTCVHIQNFTYMTVYPNSTLASCGNKNSNQFKNYSYTVNPESRNSWVALVTEDDNTFLADFSFKSKQELIISISNSISETQYTLDKINDD